jgi:16S rRNA (uracil1498-N3)-methyltransferase
MIRLHVPQPLSAGAAVLPTLDQSRYLTQVMRLKAGDALLVFNGADGEWRCVVAEVLKKGVVLKAEEQVRAQTTVPDVHLLIAVVKKAALEFAVEKATELGAARIGLVTTRRTQGDRVRMDRLEAIAVESAEQTGRLDVPAIDLPVKLEALLDGWDAGAGSGRRLMFCDETGGEPAMTALRTEAPSTASRSPSPMGGGTGEPWAILIGPEGGFAPEERERLRGLPFTTAVSLGPRVLRADTAATAALTLWQAAVGDWER